MIAKYLKKSSILRIVPIFLLMTLFACKTAQAEFKVCNKSDTSIGVAIAYHSQNHWVSQGWWQIQKNTCQILITAPLENRFYYLYAEDQNNQRKWQGDIEFCISNKQFLNTDQQNCVASGFELAGFAEYDTGDYSSWTVELNAD